jgi:vacuolar-type H+-ATPase subunit F/Vma7
MSSSDKYDAFICHASEDKDEVARPLAEALRTHGLKIWYDEFSLKTGDSLSGKIDEGLAKSDYGIIIVSKKFFEKNWPQEEFHALHIRQVILRRKVILPIWHDITKEEVLMHSPLLADKFAQINGERIPIIAANLYKEIKGIERIYDFSSDTGLRNSIASLSKSIQERESLIRQAEQEILFIILSKIYLITKGYRFAHIYYQQFAESLCAGEEERIRLREFMEDLRDMNFIASKALGTISITHEGIKEIENLLEDSSQTSSSLIVTQIKNSFKVSEKDEIREIQKLRYDILKRASDLTEEKDDVANTFEVAASLGIDIKKDHEKLVRVHFYLQDEGLIEPFAVGGRFHLTAKGRQRVKECSGRIF